MKREENSLGFIEHTPAIWSPIGLEVRKEANRENLQTAKKVVYYDKLKWIINLFEPYKSPGIDGTIVLQRGLDILYRRLCSILISSHTIFHTKT